MAANYEMFHPGEPLTEIVWEKLLPGLSTRKYGQAVREFTEAYGLDKSADREHFIEASRTKLKEMLERNWTRCGPPAGATPLPRGPSGSSPSSPRQFYPALPGTTSRR
jgi:hypothetical protein